MFASDQSLQEIILSDISWGVFVLSQRVGSEKNVRALFAWNSWLNNNDLKMVRNGLHVPNVGFLIVALKADSLDFARYA